MDRSGLIDWLTERLHDPRHPSSIRPLSDLLRTDSCCWGRAGATSPTPTACVRIRACGWRARPVGARRPWRRAPGWRHSRPCPDCWTRSAGRRTFRPAGGDGAGVPSDRDDRRPAAKTGEKDPTEEETEKDDGRTWTVSRSRSMGIPREARNGYYRQRMSTGGGELCRDGGPDRRGDFSGSQLPGEAGAEVDAPGGGPLSGAPRLDDRADGCGVPGAGAAEGLESRSVPYIARIRSGSPT